jgi:TRAP-type transport system small permease protein
VPLTIERVVLAAAMGAMVVITFANVVTRYLSNISLAFTEEYSTLLMVVVTLIGTSYAFAAGRHVRIDFFVNLLSPPKRRVAGLVEAGLAFALFVVLVAYGVKLSWDSYRFEALTPGLGHPEWIYLATVPLLGVAVVCRIVGRGLRLLCEAKAPG